MSWVTIHRVKPQLDIVSAFFFILALALEKTFLTERAIELEWVLLPEKPKMREWAFAK